MIKEEGRKDRCEGGKETDATVGLSERGLAIGGVFGKKGRIQYKGGRPD